MISKEKWHRSHKCLDILGSYLYVFFCWHKWIFSETKIIDDNKGNLRPLILHHPLFAFLYVKLIKFMDKYFRTSLLLSCFFNWWEKLFFSWHKPEYLIKRWKELFMSWNSRNIHELHYLHLHSSRKQVA